MERGVHSLLRPLQQEASAQSRVPQAWHRP